MSKREEILYTNDLDKLWESVIEKRESNEILTTRLNTCSMMIETVLSSDSDFKEKKDFVNRITRFSSELAPFRKTTELISVNAQAYVKKLRLKPTNRKHYHVPAPKKKNLRHEHVVPCAFFANHIMEKQPNRVEVYQILLRFGIRSIITDQEDDALRKSKLTKTMPVDWDFNQNPFLRYQGIEDFQGLTLKPENLYP